MIRKLALALSLVLVCHQASAQVIGGNTSISATTSTANVALPANRQAYPYAIIAPAAGSTQEVFYALGNGSVTATTSSPSLPTGGICLNLGPNTNVAAITASSTATVRITQVSSCTLFSGGGGSSGSGSTSVTQGTVPWADNITQIGGVNVSGANGLPVSSVPFTPTGTTSITAGTSSTNVALVGAGTTAIISNPTSVVAYIKFGNGSVTAATTDTPIAGGQTIPLATGGNTNIASITASGSTTLQVVTGTGSATVAYGQVASTDGIGIDTAGNITGATQTVTASMDGYDSANVLVSGTYGGFTVTFTESPDGGSHLATVSCAINDGGGTRNVSSYTLSANQTALFHCNNLNGSDSFTVTSSGGPGSGSARVDISVSAFPSVLGGTVGTLLTDYTPPSQSITAADVASTTTVGQDSVNQITGTPTTGSTASWSVTGQAAATVQLSGTWAGTESFEKSNDGGTTYVSFGCQTTGAVYRHNTVTGIGQFLCDIGGSTNFRVRQTARTSGTVIVTATFSAASTIAKVANANTLFDNTSGAQASIKPASTLPLTTDTSVVTGTADGFNVTQGALADAACASDNATCSLIALAKRVAQRLTTVNTTLGTPLQAGGTVVVTGVATAAIQTATQAPVAPATATATKSDLVGCQATSAGINPTTGQQAAVNCDLNNNILVSSGGAPNFVTAQVSVTTGNISVASVRALRRAITITNVTGTGPAYCGNTGVSTSTGAYLAGTAGSSITINTTAAVFCTVATTTQTVTVLETY